MRIFLSILLILLPCISLAKNTDKGAATVCSGFYRAVGDHTGNHSYYDKSELAFNLSVKLSPDTSVEILESSRNTMYEIFSKTAKEYGESFMEKRTRIMDTCNTLLEKYNK